MKSGPTIIVAPVATGLRVICADEYGKSKPASVGQVLDTYDLLTLARRAAKHGSVLQISVMGDGRDNPLRRDGLDRAAFYGEGASDAP